MGGPSQGGVAVGQQFNIAPSVQYWETPAGRNVRDAGTVVGSLRSDSVCLFDEYINAQGAYVGVSTLDRAP